MLSPSLRSSWTSDPLAGDQHVISCSRPSQAAKPAAAVVLLQLLVNGLPCGTGVYWRQPNGDGAAGDRAKMPASHFAFSFLQNKTRASPISKKRFKQLISKCSRRLTPRKHIESNFQGSDSSNLTWPSELSCSSELTWPSEFP